MQDGIAGWQSSHGNSLGDLMTGRNRESRGPSLTGCRNCGEHPRTPVVVPPLSFGALTEEQSMAYQFNPSDPYRTSLSEDEIRRQRLNSLDNEIQPDPE